MAASCVWCGVQASCLSHDTQGTQRKRTVSHWPYLTKNRIACLDETFIDRLKTTRSEQSTCRVASCPSNNTETSASDDGDEHAVWTEYVAETLLPTNQGKFRLRGYRHTVRDGTVLLLQTTSPGYFTSWLVFCSWFS